MTTLHQHKLKQQVKAIHWYTEASLKSRTAAASTMLRMTNFLIALSFGTQRAQFVQRTGMTCPRPFFERPLFLRFFVCSIHITSKKRCPLNGVHLQLTHNTHTRLMALFLGLPGWAWFYQKGKTNLDFTEARHNEWQWHQLSHMQVCTSLQTDNHTSSPPLSFYRPGALPDAQPSASKHWRHSQLNGSHVRLLGSTPKDIYN